MSNSTLLEKRKKAVRVSKQETLMLLRSYQLHPCNCNDIIDDMKHNTLQMSEDTRRLYENLDNKKLRDRLSTKLGTLLFAQEIKDDDIRKEVLKIKYLETKLKKSSSTSVINKDKERNAAVEAVSTDDEDGDEGTTEHREEKEKVAVPSTSKEPPKSKRPLMQLVHENQEEYNRFIKQKVPKLLKMLGVDSDSESD